MAALAASRLGARPRRTSSRSSRTRVATAALQRLKALELGQDRGVDRLEGVRVGGQVGPIQPGQGGLDLRRRVGGGLLLWQRSSRLGHDTSCDGDDAASIGPPARWVPEVAGRGTGGSGAGGSGAGGSGAGGSGAGGSGAGGSG